MTHARKYPPASTTAQWFEPLFSRATFSVIDKLLLHTTETSNWPGYDSGAKAPTLTYNPWVPAGQRWRQHNWLNTSARALQDPTSTPVRENRDSVVQVEIIAYCNPATPAYKQYGVDKLPDHFYEDMGAFLAFLHTEWEVPLVHAPMATYPPPDSIRFTSSQYDAFKGVLGHQNASGNTHGDPGLTNAQGDRIIAVARRLTTITPAPTTDLSGDIDVAAITKDEMDALFQKWTYGREHWDSQAWAYLAVAIAAAIKSMDGVDVTPGQVTNAMAEARAALQPLESSFG